MKLNDLDLNKLHVFRVVAESTSMREAAVRLLRTPSAISQSVTTLERALGAQLFNRSGIKLELTELGRRLLRQVKTNEQALRAVLDNAGGVPAGVRGRVSLGMPPGYPAVSLAEPLSAALLRYPELQLRLRFLSHAELAEALQKGQVEMALSLQPLSILNRRVKSTKLREENLILVVPLRLRYLCESATAELPVVDYHQKPMLIESWLGHHRQRKAKFRVRAFGATLEHVLQFVLRGVGCAVVPRHVVANELARGLLHEHPLDKRRPLLVPVWLNSFHQPGKLSSAGKSLWDELQR